jgi:hypothetical protein
MKAASQEQIERRAYEIWEQQGRPHGLDKEHWEQAERDLLDEATTAAPNVEYAAKSLVTAASFAASATRPAKPASEPMIAPRPLAPSVENPRRPADPAPRV